MANDKKLDSFEDTQPSLELTSMASSRETKISEPTSIPETTQSKTVDSDSLTLDEWVDFIFAEDAKKTDPASEELSKEDFRPTVNLGRFGLKTPEQVKKFLHSPAGEATIGEIGAHLALEKAIEEEQRMAQQEHRLLMSKIQALLFLWYLNKESNAAEKIKEIVIQQNEKAIEHAKSTGSETQTSSTTSQSIKDLEDTIANYSKAIEAIQNKEKVLDQKMKKLENEAAHIEIKYDIYESNLLDFEQQLDEQPNLTPEQIAAKINNLKEQMDAHVSEVDRLLRGGQDDAARSLLHILTGLNLQAASLHDMLSVHNKQKYFANEHGEEVSSIKDAQYTLDRSQKLIKDEDGKLHLIKSDENWEDIKRSPEAKEAAHQAFNQLKQNPEAMSVKKVVQHNKVLENQMNTEEVKEVSKLQKDSKAQELLIGNQISQLTATRGALLKQANQATQSGAVMEQLSTSPVPTPTPTSSGGGGVAPKLSQATPTDVYKNRLQELKQASNVTRDDLINLANQAPGKNKVAANAYLQMMFINMPRTGNIPFQTMQSMLKNLERFGIDATKEGVTSIKSPNDLKHENAKRNDLKAESSSKESVREEEPHFSPTPFSTNPFK